MSLKIWRMYVCACSVTQSCPALCYPMDCRLPGSSVHRIFQARILEWVAISSSRGYSQPRDQFQVFCISSQLVKNLPAMKVTLLWFLVGKLPCRRDKLPTSVLLGFPHGSDGKESSCNAGSIPDLGRSPEGGHGNPLLYSFFF